jgi:hypothetical protein
VDDDRREDERDDDEHRCGHPPAPAALEQVDPSNVEEPDRLAPYHLQRRRREPDHGEAERGEPGATSWPERSRDERHGQGEHGSRQGRGQGRSAKGLHGRLLDLRP